jgi:lysylphosphatidylglycerol synthetase-like protein (DUF2156 family)
MEGDKRVGNRTIGLWLGASRSYILSSSLLALSIVIGYLMKEPLIFLAGLIALPWFLLALIRKRRMDCLLSTHIGVAVLTLLAGLIFPYFLAFLLLVILAARLYHRHRFGIPYPGVPK